MTAYDMRISDWSSDVCSSDLPVGMVMGGVSDGTEYCSRESCARNAARPFPCRLRWHAGQSAIAGKGELTTGNAFRSLEHHAANSVRKSGMAQALEDDLNNRAFS